MWIIFVIMVAGVAFLLGGSYVNRSSAHIIERKRLAYLHARSIYATHPDNANYRSLVERVGREYIAVEDPVIFNEHELDMDIRIITNHSEL
jgi:hypothetical protein